MRSCFLLAFLLASTPAYAERVGVVVTGEATVQPLVYAQLETWLREHGHQVVPAPLEPEAISTLIDCFVLEDLGCARGVVDTRSRARVVIYARAEATQNDDGTRDIAVTGHWFQKNYDTIAERRMCERCSDQALQTTVDNVMLALAHAPPSPLAGDQVQADAAPVVEEREDRFRRMLPMGLMVVGGVALVAGGIMIAIDQDPSPNGMQEARYRDTATGGVLLGLAGLAAAGGGYYLGWSGRF